MAVSGIGLEVRGLSHRFGPREVLSGIDLRLARGEVVSVVGPSGGGKSTLLHLCAGLLEVERGRIDNRFDSHAFAFQEPRLLPWQTTLDNIAFGLKARGVERRRRHRLAAEIALRFGLDVADLDKFPGELSGGMRQRASFARALVIRPALLLLDEPFSALDIGLKRELQRLLVDRVAEGDLSVLFITHDLMEAVRLSDRILLLAADPGRIVAEFTIDAPREARDDPFVHRETARLLAEPAVVESFGLGDES